MSKVAKKYATRIGADEPLTADSRVLAGVMSPPLTEQQLLERLIARTTPPSGDPAVDQQAVREEHRKYFGGDHGLSL